MYIFLSAFPHGSAGARIHTHIQMSARDVLSKILNSMNMHKGYLKEQRIAFCAYTASLKPLLTEVNFKNRHANVTGCNKWSAFCSANMIGWPRHQSTQPRSKALADWYGVTSADTVSLLWNPSCDLNKISSQSVYYAVWLLLIFCLSFLIVGETTACKM